MEGSSKPGAFSPGQALVRHLRDKMGFHPIIMFGTQYSGKSAVLLSLLAYAKYHPELRVQVDFAAQGVEELFPEEYEEAKGVEHSTRFNWANSIYDDQASDFEAGWMPESTQVRQPIYVPIQLRREDVTTKFLFVEANGEWFDRDRKTGAYKPLVDEFQYLLRYYDRPMSVIFVVPVVQARAHDFNLMLDCIGKCISEYSWYGRGQFGDNLLLLGSQWDKLPGNKLIAAPASGVSAAEFLAAVTRWDGVWAPFLALQNVRKGSRAAMPYSIGPVRQGTEGVASEAQRAAREPDLEAEETRRQTGEADRAANVYAGAAPPLPRRRRGEPNRAARMYAEDSIFTQFPRILWNWLYANANQDLGNSGSRTRPTLFPDVDVEHFPNPSIWARFMVGFFSTQSKVLA